MEETNTPDMPVSLLTIICLCYKQCLCFRTFTFFSAIDETENKTGFLLMADIASANYNRVFSYSLCSWFIQGANGIFDYQQSSREWHLDQCIQLFMHVVGLNIFYCLVQNDLAWKKWCVSKFSSFLTSVVIKHTHTHTNTFTRTTPNPRPHEHILKMEKKTKKNNNNKKNTFVISTISIKVVSSTHYRVLGSISGPVQTQHSANLQ